MSPGWLERHRLEFADLPRARAWMDSTFGARVDDSWAPARKDRLLVASVQTLEMTFVRVLAAPDARFHIRGRGEYVFMTQHAGAIELAHGHSLNRYGAGDVFVAVQPGDRLAARNQGIDLGSVHLPAWLLDQSVQLSGGSPRQRWRFSTEPVEVTASRQWQRAAVFARSLLDEHAAVVSPLIVGQAARLLAATALQCFPNTALSAASSDGDTDAHPGTLRRAIAFIESHLETDMTLADIAAAAYVTPRAVQLAFRRHLDTTPTAYLKRVRLRAAREQLLQAAPGDRTTITGVAHQWGFSGPSRFAQQYRDAYGELPSRTLRR